jgi:argininosuccinate lyase
MKLWKKNTDTDSLIHQFTVGKDREFDLLLARHDVIGSVAHVKMLASVNIITQHEAELLISELHSILGSIESGRFRIEENCEDVHSQIEMLLTNRLGAIGKKVHTARSRNDQSLLDIKLYIREELELLSQQTIAFANTLIDLAEAHQHTLLPGYTHFQLAMPSSFGLWFSAYAEALLDDLELVKAAYHVANRNPLGSAAGYGSSFPIDREFTTRELNFPGMNVSSVYAQMTRGKTEKFAATALSAIAATLGKLAADITLYMNQEFGYVSHPENMTTGSSIMPHKKNPDPWELIRAKANRIQSLPNELALLLANLPSGYHRDYQLTKEILFPGIESLKDMLELGDYLVRNLEVKKDILADRKYDMLFTVDAINQLVQAGIPFREAYQMIGREVESGTFTRPADATHTHIGSLGNPGLELIRSRVELFSLHPTVQNAERAETSTH